MTPYRAPAPPDVARRRASRRKGVVFWIFAIPILLLAIACWYAFGPQPPPPPPHIAAPSPQRVAKAQQDLNSVKQFLMESPTSLPVPPARTIRSAPSPQPGAPTVARRKNAAPETLTITQNDVNAELSGSAALRAFLLAHGVRDAAVQFQAPDQITILAAADFKGLQGNAQVQAQALPGSSSAIKLQIVNARFGRFPQPVVRAAAQSIVNDILQKLRSKSGVRVLSARVSGQDLILQAQRLPASGN